MDNQIRAWMRFQSDLSGITLDKCAKHVGASKGKINRVLTRKGTSYTRLLFDERGSRILRVLTHNPTASVDEMAEGVGMSIAGVYTHFGKWTGVEWKVYKKSIQDTDDRIKRMTGDAAMN